MPLEGQQIGRYSFLRLLGSGGMGNVYLAEDARIEQQVAVKVIRVEGDLYPKALAAQNELHLFRREAKAIARLDHPNILPLFDYGEERLGDTTIIYLVMPYRPEGSLANWLRRHCTVDLLSHQAVDHIVCQAAEALQHAHNRQIIHQDVKPTNFLLRQQEDMDVPPDILLADFGIARFMTAISSTSQSICGTPTYMAPEQWEGKPVFATDQYAMAVMTYELLTGQPPFQGGPGRMLYQHLNVEPSPPSTLNSRLSSEIDKVLLRALAKIPEQRFASISAFATAFHQVIQSMQNEHAPTLSDASKIALSTDEYRAVHAISASEETRPVANSAGVETPLPVENNESSETQLAANMSTQPAVDSAYSNMIEPAAISVIESFAKNENSMHKAEPEQSDMSREVQKEAVNILEEREQIVSPKNVELALPTQGNNITAPRRSIRRQPVFVLALLLLILLLAFGGIASASYGTFSFLPQKGTGTVTIRHSPPTASAGPVEPVGPLPASSAIMTIIPMRAGLTKAYTILAVPGSPDASQHQVRARLLSATTQAYAQTVNATGQGTIPGTHASGTAAIDNFDTTSSITLTAGSVFASNYSPSIQIHMVLDATVTVPPAPSSTVWSQGYAAGHILEVGTVGNNEFNNNINGTLTWSVFNNPPFSNGQDPQTYTFVQQSDINNAANALIRTNTPNPQQILQPQIQANERLIGSPQCQSNVKSNHAAGDKAKSLTVTVSFTCTGEVYDEDGARAMAAGFLTAQAINDPGKGYVLVGNVTTTLTSATLTNASSGTITLTINAEGIWLYQFSDAQKQAMAMLVAGKTKNDAHMLLVKQQGVKEAGIQIVGGDGNTLPMHADQISVVVKSVSGL